MATTLMNVTLADVQWLADRPRGAGMVVSCYADTSISAGVRPLWREHLNNEVQRIEQRLAPDAPAMQQVRRNIDVIEATLESPAARRAKGMAVFAAAARDMVRAFVLTAPVPNRIVIDEDAYLVPLFELLHRQRRYLVVHTDTHRGRLYTAASGAAHAIEEINENVPKRQRSAGELWGKQQATIARHREDHILHYIKELAREIERAWSDERYDGIVLLGEHEVLEEVRKHIPDYLARRIMHEAPHAWAGRQPRLETKIAAVHADALRADDDRVLKGVQRRLMERHQIATGAQAVIDAIRNSQVGYPGAVVMEPDRGETASRCVGCRSIFADAKDQCPYCQAGCERSNLWQEIALLAARHDIPLHFVAAGLGLEKQGGVVALLAREEPWAAPSESAMSGNAAG
jgi:hypothetical protein